MAEAETLKLRVQSISFQTDQVVVYEFRDVDGRQLPGSEPGSHIDVHLGKSFVVNGGQKARKSGAGQKVGTKLAIASAAFRRSTING